jgi:hypothetical protein
MWMILAVVLVVLLVFVIAAFAIGRETHRLDAMPPAPSFELVYAVDWIAERLPEDVSAQITYEDVRDIVDWHLQELQEHGLKQAPDAATGEVVLVDDSAAVDAVMYRALAEGREFTLDQVKAVLDGELAYMEAIGAVGAPADDASDAETVSGLLNDSP